MLASLVFIFAILPAAVLPDRKGYQGSALRASTTPKSYASPSLALRALPRRSERALTYALGATSANRQ